MSPGYADGFRCDTEGNFWSSADDGVHCIDPSGAVLGKLFTPAAISNLCFGRREHNWLYLCAVTGLM